MTRGQRNNNPLNIRHSTDKFWEGNDLAFDNNRKAILKKEQEALRALDEYWDWSPQ